MVGENTKTALIANSVARRQKRLMSHPPISRLAVGFVAHSRLVSLSPACVLPCTPPVRHRSITGGVLEKLQIFVSAYVIETRRVPPIGAGAGHHSSGLAQPVIYRASTGAGKPLLASHARASGQDRALSSASSMVLAALALASRSRALLSRARTSSAVVRECCNMVTITGSANNSSMVGSRLLMYMVTLTPIRSNRARKPGTVLGQGGPADSCWLPDSRAR